MENLKICKNCDFENVHYYKDWLINKTDFLICSICRIETPNIKQIKLF